MNIKKIVSMVLSCAVLTVSVLSVGASAYITFGPYTTAEYYGSGVMMYKYTTGIDTSTVINMTLDGKNYINKIAMGSDYVKEASTDACIYSGGTTTASRFNNNFSNSPATSTTLNKGLIAVSAAAYYYASGTNVMPLKKYSESSKNWASVKAGSILTSEALTSYGTIEYKNNIDTLYVSLYTVNY